MGAYINGECWWEWPERQWKEMARKKGSVFILGFSAILPFIVFKFLQDIYCLQETVSVFTTLLFQARILTGSILYSIVFQKHIIFLNCYSTQIAHILKCLQWLPTAYEVKSKSPHYFNNPSPWTVWGEGLIGKPSGKRWEQLDKRRDNKHWWKGGEVKNDSRVISLSD